MIRAASVRLNPTIKSRFSPSWQSFVLSSTNAIDASVSSNDNRLKYDTVSILRIQRIQQHPAYNYNLTVRCFSSSSEEKFYNESQEVTPPTATETTSSSSSDLSSMSVDETLDKLFAESQQQQVTDNTDAWYATAEQSADAVSAVAVAWEPTWYNLSDQAVLAVQTFHNFTGLEYGYSIIGVTILMRMILFPLMISSHVNSSRMAHLQPELNHMKERYEALDTPSRQDQLQFSNNMKALMKKYNVKPFRAFLAPLAQVPLFMGMFFGMRKMPHLFPQEFSTGGMLWFQDLTATDPLYILPVCTTLTFLAMNEVNRKMMPSSSMGNNEVMINVFRGLSIMMFPICLNFEASMLCYWTSNNIVTMSQTLLLNYKPVRRYFGIWDKPKPVPGTPDPSNASLRKTVEDFTKWMSGKTTSVKKEIEANNKAVEAKKNAFKMLQAAKQKQKQSGINETKDI